MDSDSVVLTGPKLCMNDILPRDTGAQIYELRFEETGVRNYIMEGMGSTFLTPHMNSASGENEEREC